MVLILVGFLAATAQNNITSYERFDREITYWGHSKFGKNDLILKKQKSDDVWWEPDTVYLFLADSEHASD
jgi:predicted porin